MARMKVWVVLVFALAVSGALQADNNNPSIDACAGYVEAETAAKIAMTPAGDALMDARQQARVVRAAAKSKARSAYEAAVQPALAAYEAAHGVRADDEVQARAAYNAAEIQASGARKIADARANAAYDDAEAKAAAAYEAAKATVKQALVTAYFANYDSSGDAGLRFRTWFHTRFRFASIIGSRIDDIEDSDVMMQLVESHRVKCRELHGL